jgi:hypothetical protein
VGGQGGAPASHTLALTEELADVGCG